MGLKAEIAYCLARTAAEVTAMFSPVPGVYPAVELLCSIIELCEKVPRNKNAARHLLERCVELLLSYKKAFERAKDLQESLMMEALENIYTCLQDIQIQMSTWTQMKFAESFTKQDQIKCDIEKCHVSIDDCFTKFQVMSQLDMQQWRTEFAIRAAEDHKELVKYLSEIKNAQVITQQSVNETNKMMFQVMGMMQRMMGENLQIADRIHYGLSTNLYHLATRASALLPDLHLKYGEVRRIGHYPVSGTAAMDIYEGLYLDTEKVAIKVVRAVNVDDHTLRRFNREVRIWADIWYKDKGQHILPFYGFCDNDGPFPYMVSPWQSNGSVLTYVKKYDPVVNYKDMIVGIAKGVQVLHSMSPPVVHGDIKSANIVVGRYGRPLIADFGLSRIVEDITGIPFTQSRGVSDSYRWFAPEVCIGSGVLSMNADIYAYGMTVLEILTHNQPFAEIKHTTEVVIRTSQGQHPARPTHPDVVRRGMDDDLWNLLLRCWSQVPTERPNIHEVLETLQS